MTACGYASLTVRIESSGSGSWSLIAPMAAPMIGIVKMERSAMQTYKIKMGWCYTCGKMECSAVQT